MPWRRRWMIGVSKRRDVLDVRPAASSLGSAVVFPDRPRTHTVRRGETLFAIAKAAYGDGSQWDRLATANPSAANAPLRVGQLLVVP